MRRILTPDERLDIELSGICSRNRYASDPTLVLDELQRTAGSRVDILVRVAGSFAGYFEADASPALVAALREVPGTDPWVAEGRRRRGIPTHGAPIPTAEARHW